MELVPCPYAKKGVTCQSIACIESGFLHSEFSQESRMTTGSRQHPGKVFGAWVTLAAALVVVSCVVRLDRAAIFFGSWRLADLTGIRHVSGFTYVAPTHRPELSAHAAPSQAQVWEDGRPLPGPPNALHDDIRETGGGAYSFWYNYVYFSTPDHSDPTTNGRHYQIFYPGMVPMRLRLRGVGLGPGTRFTARSCRRKRPSLGALGRPGGRPGTKEIYCRLWRRLSAAI